MALTLLQMNEGKKAFGAQALFSSVVFSVNEGEHIGVIGPNGAGKTTLFKIINGDEELDAGQLITSNSLSLAYLSQHDIWKPDETGNSYLEKVSRLPLWQVKSFGRDLRIPEDVFTRPIVSLSGGYRMRIKLMGLLGSDPNLMLLDEPTNYLDLETTLLLERFLQNYRGAFLLISHDREFLRRTTDHILEVEAGEVTKYNGNIDDYFEQKELLRSQVEAQARNQAEKRKVLLDFIERFGAKATKAKQAQSKMKALEKMEAIEFKSVPVTATIKIPEPSHVGKSVLQIRGADFGYGDRRVLSGVSVEIRRGDHVAVVGLNGAGKSTLLKGLAGTLAPTIGAREVGYQVELAIFNQHVIESLNPSQSVMEALEEAARNGVSLQDVRNMAGALLFSADHMQKKIEVLSGGEKSRVALGRILLQRVPLLLLDEPTNHLDFQTVEALTQALKKFNGTLVVVSHDRGFIRRVANRILDVTNGHVSLYPGTYDEYVWKLQRELLAGETVVPSQETEPASTPTSNRRERDRKRRAIDRRAAQIEQELENLERRNSELSEQIVSGHADSVQLTTELAANVNQLQALEEEWLKLEEEREEWE